MRHLAFVIFLAFPLALLSQAPDIVRTKEAIAFVQFNRHCARSNLATHDKDYKRALAHCDSAIAIVPWETSVYPDAVKAAVLLNNFALARSYDEKGSRYGVDLKTCGDSTVRAFLDDRLDQGDPYWEKRYGSHPSEAPIYMDDGPETKPEVRLPETTRETISRIDRVNRAGPYQAALYPGQTDSVLRADLLALCQLSGFPNDPQDGAQIELDLMQILFAFPIDSVFTSPFWMALLPHIQRSIDRGETNPIFLAFYADFNAHQRNEPLPYAIPLDWFIRRDGSVRLAERKQLNAARAALGLMSIEDSARLSEIDLTKVARQ